jgi:hypothetical protein
MAMILEQTSQSTYLMQMEQFIAGVPSRDTLPFYYPTSLFELR